MVSFLFTSSSFADDFMYVYYFFIYRWFHVYLILLYLQMVLLFLYLQMVPHSFTIAIHVFPDGFMVTYLVRRQRSA